MAPARENFEKSSSHATDRHAGKRRRAHSRDETEQLVFTVGSGTGTIVKVEKIDSRGARREIREEEATNLAGKDRLREIDLTLDEAFEAGIASVIEPGSSLDTNGISDEEVELRRELLSGIIEQGTRRRLRSRLVGRLILAKALAH